MACQGVDTTTAQQARLQQVFSQFWPASLPFPPMAPYLAAMVTRSEALSWAVAIGADRNPRVLSGDTTAILGLVGKAMMDPAGVYEAERKKKKKKDERPEIPEDVGEDLPTTLDENGCYSRSCSGCGEFCCTQKICPGGTDGPCTPCMYA